MCKVFLAIMPQIQNVHIRMDTRSDVRVALMCVYYVDYRDHTETSDI